MTNQTKNIVLILLAIAAFTGVVIEITEGSFTFGIFLFLVSILLLSRINFKNLGEPSSSKISKIQLIVGVFIVLADLSFNFEKGGRFGTLDIMMLFFGLSLAGSQMPNINIARISRFGMYFSSVFIVLFLIFYTIFPILHIDLMYKFDHYFLLLPTVWILNLAGLPLEPLGIETVHISGVQDMTIAVASPCSGLYSMFLLIGIIVAYSRMEKMDSKKTLKMLGFCIVIAHVSNMFRISILFLTAYFYGPEIMMTVHTHLGWIIFACIAAFIMYLLDRK